MTFDAVNIGQALYATLNAVTALTGKVYPMRVPQENSFPAVVYYIISNTPEETKEAGSVVDLIRVQISAFDYSYATLQTLCQAIRDAMVSLGGEVGNVSIDTVRLSDETELYEEDTKIYHKAMDYLIRINNN